MNALAFLIPLALLIVVGAIALFFWAVENDQFEDMDTPGLLPLDDPPADRKQHE